MEFEIKSTPSLTRIKIRKEKFPAKGSPKTTSVQQAHRINKTDWRKRTKNVGWRSPEGKKKLELIKLSEKFNQAENQIKII